MNKRIEWLDSLKGLAIILVIWGHLNIPIKAETIIYSFHMPLFFFISGYLFKKNNRSLNQYIERKVYSLLIPYVFFAIASIPYEIYLDLIFRDELSILNILLHFFFLSGSVGWNAPIWFLIVLFLIEVIYFIIDNSRINNAIFIILSFILGYTFAISGIRYPLGLHIVSWGLVFYYLGNLASKKLLIQKITESKSKTIINLLLLAMLNIVFGLIMNIKISVYINQLGNYLYFYIAAVAGILFLFSLMSKMPSFSTLNKILNFFGRNTLLILVTHYFALYIFKLSDERVFGYSFMDHNSYFISLLLTIVILIPYFPLAYYVNKYLPFIVGKRRNRMQSLKDSIAQ